MASFLARWGRVSLHICMLAAVLMLLLVVDRDIKHTPPTYVDNATIVFMTNIRSLELSPNSTVDGSLITTDAVAVGNLMDSQSKTLVREAGGTADFNLSLINFDNQDFPEYSYPLAALMTQSANPLVAQRTFNAAVEVLRHLLAGLQLTVRQADRISLSVVGVTGPVRKPGSLKRSLAAIGLLAVIGMGVLSSFLSRNRSWLGMPPRRYKSVASKHVPRHRMPRKTSGVIAS